MTRAIRASVAPICPYCNEPAVLMPTSSHVYHGRDYGPIWQCIPCAAYVGCHKGTTNPLGTPANATTRALKMRAHAAFDPLWKRKMVRDGLKQGHARAKGYAWLAETLGIPSEKCHMGMMVDADLLRVAELCERYL